MKIGLAFYEMKSASEKRFFFKLGGVGTIWRSTSLNLRKNISNSLKKKTIKIQRISKKKLNLTKNSKKYKKHAKLF